MKEFFTEKAAQLVILDAIELGYSRKDQLDKYMSSSAFKDRVDNYVSLFEKEFKSTWHKLK